MGGNVVTNATDEPLAFGRLPRQPIHVEGRAPRLA